MSDAEIYLWAAVALYICGFFVMGGMLGLSERRGNSRDTFFILTWPLIVIFSAAIATIETIRDAWRRER